MNREQIFSIWAPPAVIWSRWVKPVLFSYMSPRIDETPGPMVDVAWADATDGKTAMVIDLPGPDGVAAGLSLLPLGYRPIPLYNACPEMPDQPSLVEVRPIMAALASGVSTLLNHRMSDNSPPVFLLDSNRRSARIPESPGVLDNRSISLPTDFPSANLLQSRGIQRVILVQATPENPQADVSHTLRRWQDAGLDILSKATNNSDVPRVVNVKTPRLFRVLWYNLAATMGLKRAPLGGFGGVLPLPGGG